jgi:hypothetical protein
MAEELKEQQRIAALEEEKMKSANMVRLTFVDQI